MKEQQQERKAVRECIFMLSVSIKQNIVSWIVFSKRYTEVLIPCTCEWDLVWK